mgnify:CR=1 FL=1
MLKYFEVSLSYFTSCRVNRAPEVISHKKFWGEIALWNYNFFIKKQIIKISTRLAYNTVWETQEWQHYGQVSKLPLNNFMLIILSLHFCHSFPYAHTFFLSHILLNVFIWEAILKQMFSKIFFCHSFFVHFVFTNFFLSFVNLFVTFILHISRGECKTVLSASLFNIT